MSANFDVGNLPYQATSADLPTRFAPHGEGKEARVIAYRETGRPRGPSFVETALPKDAEAAIESPNGRNLDCRGLTVNSTKGRSR